MRHAGWVLYRKRKGWSFGSRPAARPRLQPNGQYLPAPCAAAPQMRSTRNFVVDVVLICVLLAIGAERGLRCRGRARPEQRMPCPPWQPAGPTARAHSPDIFSTPLRRTVLVQLPEVGRKASVVAKACCEGHGRLMRRGEHQLAALPAALQPRAVCASFFTLC